MNACERIEKAITQNGPDRVPVYEQTFFSEVAGEIMGRPMHTGGGSLHFEEVSARYKSEEAWKDFVYKMLDDCIALFKELDFDMVRMPWRFSGKASERIDENTFRFENKSTNTYSIYRFNHDSRGFNEIESSIGKEGEAAIERILDRWEDDFTEEYDLSAYWDKEYLYSAFRGEKAICDPAGQIMVPLDPEYLMALYSNKELVVRNLDMQVKAGKKNMRIAKELGAAVLSAGGDMADNSGPIYSPDFFRELILPRVKELTDYAHSLGLFYLYRTDGKTLPLAEDLYVNSNIDVLGEIDYQAGMRLDEIRKRAPKLCLWGNIDCGQVLSNGTPEDVREHSKRCIDGAYADGGHILGSSNSVIHTVPAANYMALLDTACTYGVYSK